MKTLKIIEKLGLVACLMTLGPIYAGGEENMKSSASLEQQLREMPAPYERHLTLFVAALKRDSLKRLREAVTLWLGPDVSLATKARAVLNEVGSPALDPLLEAPLPITADDKLWMVRVLTEETEALRARIAAKLDPLLSDQAKIPTPPMKGPGTEEGTPPSRLCDEVFLHARRLITPTESSEDYYNFMYKFLRLPEAQKNKEITQWRHSAAWLRLVQARKQVP